MEFPLKIRPDPEVLGEAKQSFSGLVLDRMVNYWNDESDALQQAFLDARERVLPRIATNVHFGRLELRVELDLPFPKKIPGQKSVRHFDMPQCDVGEMFRDLPPNQSDALLYRAAKIFFNKCEDGDTKKLQVLRCGDGCDKKIAIPAVKLNYIRDLCSKQLADLCGDVRVEYRGHRDEF